MRLNRLIRSAGVVTILVTGAFVACEDAEEPPLASEISIFSGDNQYSMVGTQLDEPLTVSVRLPDNIAAQGFVVQFQILSGDATLSNGTDNTDDAGQASTRVTLGMTEGQVRVRAILGADETQYVDFTATASQFFCPEEDPTFQRKFPFAPDNVRLFLFTRFSLHNVSDGQPVSGIVQIIPRFNAAPAVFESSSEALFPEDFVFNVPKDCAFSRSGDFFVAQSEVAIEVNKLNPDGSRKHLAFLDDINGSELDTSPGVILAGCDAYGPFALGCRDTLARFTEATYSGVGSDRCNNDAFAVDQTSEDMYFIYHGDNMLKRLPLDSLVVEGPLEDFVLLTQEEVDGARGMAIDDDGNIFILVDTDNVKQIVRVTPAQVKTTEVDFTTRGAGTLAGVQRDLAIWRFNSILQMLFTIDTENNTLLAWDIVQQRLTELVPDPDPALSIPEALSRAGNSGERIGLSVLP